MSESETALRMVDPGRDGVFVALPYATADNLTGQVLYNDPRCWLRPEALTALLRARDLARPLGLTLLVLDGWRPRAAQAALWAACPDERYVAPPWRGSVHTRGVAIDLTLAEVSGATRDMGTGFDDMTDASHHGQTDLAPTALANRHLLLGIMTAAGWQHNPFEWWHYQLPDWERFGFIDARPHPR